MTYPLFSTSGVGWRRVGEGKKTHVKPNRKVSGTEKKT